MVTLILVMTHAPVAEAHFIDQGFGIEAQRVMHNDFVLVGPKDDKPKHQLSSVMKISDRDCSV